MLDDVREEPSSCDAMRSALIYNSFSARLAHTFKYSDRLEQAPFLAKFLASAGHTLFAASDMLIPVPLHPLRLWKRRYNQAAVLAHALSKWVKLPVITHVLVRPGKTVPQVGLSRSERLGNLYAALGVQHVACIAQKTVILIDDVITTGATMESCAHILKRHGAKKVYALSVWRTLPNLLKPWPK